MKKEEWFDLVRAEKLTQEHIEQWLSEGNSIDNQNEWGDTALIETCLRGNYEIAQLLIERGADVNQQNIWGDTVLMLVCTDGHYEIAKILLKNGADVNHQDEKGWTALIWACRWGYYTVAQLLIENDVDVNIQHKDGWTALMWACQNGYYEIAKLLLEGGANPYLLNNAGESIYDFDEDETKELIIEYHPYYLHKGIKKYINKKNKNILNIKKINIPLNKLI